MLSPRASFLYYRNVQRGEGQGVCIVNLQLMPKWPSPATLSLPTSPGGYQRAWQRLGIFERQGCHSSNFNKMRLRKGNVAVKGNDKLLSS